MYTFVVYTDGKHISEEILKYLFLSSLAIILSGSSTFAEVVQTSDGRLVDLRDDGTYAFVDAGKQTDSDFVEYREHFFTYHEAKYGRKRIRFMPMYKNIGDKRIVGVKFTAKFLNAFGDVKYVFSGELDEPVSPGKTSTSKMFYYFEDNQFSTGEPYDKLLPMVTNNSGSIEVIMNMVAFEGGDIVKFSE